MPTYTLCVVSKEYRWLDVDAVDAEHALNQAYNDIDNILNRKADDYDTEVIVESFEI